MHGEQNIKKYIFVYLLQKVRLSWYFEMQSLLNLFFLLPFICREFRRVSICSKLGYFLLQINGFYTRSCYGSKNNKCIYMVIIKIAYVFSGGLLQN